MKNPFSRPLLVFGLLALLASPAFYSCNTETAFAKETREAMERQKAVDDTVLLNYLTRNRITNYTRTNTGLYVINDQEGTGPTIAPGNRFLVRYVGTMLGLGRDAAGLRDNTGFVFESTYDNATACRCAEFTAGNQIAGWNEGVQLMRAGAQKTLLIPSGLAYGPSGSTNGPARIPQNQCLMFRMEILSVAQ